MHNLLTILTNYRQLQILLLGIFSGMPLTIIYSTLAAWLTMGQIDLSVITTFAIARIFYSLKFLWSPIVDQLPIPLLSRLGQRKSWIIFCMAIISAIFYSYSQIANVSDKLSLLYFLTITLGFASATLDIAIDAYRIEIISQDTQAIAASNAVFGYMIGGLIAGAGVFFIADNYGWSKAFQTIAVLYIIGAISILTLKTPNDIATNTIDKLNLQKRIIGPFKDFMQRPGSIVILLAIIFYKLGDAMLGVVATPFYLKLGFSLAEIAVVVKSFGLVAIIVGSYLGGILMYRCGTFIGLMSAGFIQAITNIAFIWLHHQGHQLSSLTIAIMIENLGSGMGNAVLVGYLSSLCNRQFSATQYALLSSAAGLGSHSLVVFGGDLVQMLGWDNYFIMTIILALPGLLLFYLLHRIYRL